MTDKEFEEPLDEVAGERANDINVKPDPRFTETRYGLTPNGGAYSTAYYYDKDGYPCVKAKAKTIHIIEFSKDGERINETYGVLG